MTYFVAPGKRKTNFPVDQALLDAILYASCEVIGTSKEQVRARRGPKQRPIARFYASYLMRTMAGAVYEDIASFIGRYDHSGVVYGVRKIRDWLDVYPEETRETLNKIKQKVYERYIFTN